MPQVIILGEYDPLHEHLCNSCGAHVDSALLSYAQCGGTLLPVQLEKVGCIIISLCTPWEISQVKYHPNYTSQPIIGVSAFVNDRLLEHYQNQGLSHHYSMEQLNNNSLTLLSAIMEVSFA